MRAITLAATLFLASAAGADSKVEPKREPPPPPRVQEIAHRLFEEANAAMNEGKLDIAISKYHELDRLAPHPNISFNLALAYERKGDLVEAIEYYDKYLAVETTDKAAQKHTDDLRTTPGHVKLEAKSKLGVKAVWFFDGDFVAKGSTTVDLAPGSHRVDMVSELGYRGYPEKIEPGSSRNRGNNIEADADARSDGNLIITHTADDHWGWFYKIDGSDRNDALGKDVHHDGRYVIAPGKHDITVRDSVCDYDTSITVGKDELVLVYFDRKGFDEKALLKNMKRDSPSCGKLGVKRSVVKF
jgi:tetratricopeptide (TPR) repeat protein